MAESREFLPFCSARSLVNPRPNERQNLEKTSLLMVLYSNVHGLHQARGELCRMQLAGRSCPHLWNNLPPDLLLTGTTCGWRSILKQAQRHVT